MSDVKERPIIFSGEMVRAILDGRKTMTRRVVDVSKIKPSIWTHETIGEIRPVSELGPNHRDEWQALLTKYRVGSHGFKCPYGKPGSKLWVRESFCHFGNRYSHGHGFGLVKYLADGTMSDMPSSSLPDHNSTDSYWRKNRPSIHMPRWASRITLEITDVRVERLQDISATDVQREGVDLEGGRPGFDVDIDGGLDNKFIITRFAELWDKISGKKHPWASNPFVWIVEFSKL